MIDWIRYSTIKPQEGTPLWYYFEITGVSKGEYFGEWCFGGERGFLTGDVTHWRYHIEGESAPEKPKNS